MQTAVTEKTARNGSIMVASATTFDGIRVEIWSDGGVTQTRFGFYIEGIGHKKLPNDVVWLFAGEIGIFDLSELPTLFEVARKMAQEPLGQRQPGHLRAEATRLLEV